MTESVAEVKVSDEVLQEYKKVRLGNAKTMVCLVLKINREDDTVIIEEKIEDANFDDLQTYLDDCNLQPRFLILSYVWQRGDRVQYPLLFIFYTPKNANPYDQSRFFNISK